MTRPAWRNHLYCSVEEAEARTGYFYVESVKITIGLALQIHSYVYHEGVDTHIGVNQAHTSQNTYTCNFCLKMYHYNGQANPNAYAYLDRRGAWGNYKGPGSEQKRAALADRTPSLEQMFFWICRKYPDDVLWLNFSLEKPRAPYIKPTLSS